MHGFHHLRFCSGFFKERQKIPQWKTHRGKKAALQNTTHLKSHLSFSRHLEPIIQVTHVDAKARRGCGDKWTVWDQKRILVGWPVTDREAKERKLPKEMLKKCAVKCSLMITSTENEMGTYPCLHRKFKIHYRRQFCLKEFITGTRSNFPNTA